VLTLTRGGKQQWRLASSLNNRDEKYNVAKEEGNKPGGHLSKKEQGRTLQHHIKKRQKEVLMRIGQTFPSAEKRKRKGEKNSILLRGRSSRGTERILSPARF